MLDARDRSGAGRAGGSAGRAGSAERRRLRLGRGPGDRLDPAPAGPAGRLAGGPPGPAGYLEQLQVALDLPGGDLVVPLLPLGLLGGDEVVDVVLARGRAERGAQRVVLLQLP